MSSELVCLVGTASFVPSLLPWLPLRPVWLMGKGAWARSLGFSRPFPAWRWCPAGWAQGSCVTQVSQCPSWGDTSAKAALLLACAAGIPAGTSQRQEGKGTSHGEEVGQVRARDPLSLEAENQGELWAPPFLLIQFIHSQSAPGLNGGCGGLVRAGPQPLRDGY